MHKLLIIKTQSNNQNFFPAFRPEKRATKLFRAAFVPRRGGRKIASEVKSKLNAFSCFISPLDNEKFLFNFFFAPLRWFFMRFFLMLLMEASGDDYDRNFSSPSAQMNVSFLSVKLFPSSVVVCIVTTIYLCSSAVIWRKMTIILEAKVFDSLSSSCRTKRHSE